MERVGRPWDSLRPAAAAVRRTDGREDRRMDGRSAPKQTDFQLSLPTATEAWLFRLAHSHSLHDRPMRRQRASASAVCTRTVTLADICCVCTSHATTIDEIFVTCTYRYTHCSNSEINKCLPIYVGRRKMV